VCFSEDDHRPTAPITLCQGFCKVEKYEKIVAFELCPTAKVWHQQIDHPFHSQATTCCLAQTLLKGLAMQTLQGQFWSLGNVKSVNQSRHLELIPLQPRCELQFCIFNRIFGHLSQ
jgi:hypothetical protein